ncbi:hypothetical protein FACS189459_0690 [Bacilli bacterium]|nr:hypothetical protein FACS189459_0690 [Bacilli bacterium]
MNKFKVFISGIISLLILFAITVIILLLIYSVNIFIIWPIILGAIIVNAIIGIYIMNSKKRTDDVKIS